MTDFLGKEVAVGDKVVFIEPRCKEYKLELYRK
jgi:hypothetical protein